MGVLSESQIRNLPLPTPEQHRTFVEHLCNAHSWYKHLPLLTGGIFAVFLSPNAGVGYPSEHPRLPYGNTVEGYRRAFGCLDYVWSAIGDLLDHDGGQAPALPPSLLERCQFVLYPYVSEEFYWSVHKDAVADLRDGTNHPQRERLLEWEAAAWAVDQAEIEGAEVSKQIRLRAEASAHHAALRVQEVARIEQHLHRLYQWCRSEDG